MDINSLSIPEDKKKILETLVSKVKEQYSQDIALIACYGSYFNGTAHDKSDLDFYFIPATDKAYDMCMQFILDDIGYDFWPIFWERAERIARFEEPLIPLIADATVVYYRSPDDRKRFEGLRETIAGLLSPEKKGALLERAEAALKEAKAIFYDALQQQTYSTVRMLCADCLGRLLASVAYMNSSYIRKGTANFENEVKRFSCLPEGFLDLFRESVAALTLEDALAPIQKLIANAELLLENLRPKSSIRLSNDSAKGFYEEAKSTYNKLAQACETRNTAGAFFAARAIEAEVRSLLGDSYQSFGFPDLLFPLKDQFSELKERGALHESILVKALRQANVSINAFESLQAFTDYMNNKA
ncbi:MAG: hypothetical protein N2376_12915 [Clostridia bacterium]|nr:hypothetical protein [Clostridia bacterium]